MPNPFFFGGKIVTPRHFVGREKELKKIFGYLNTEHTGQIQHVSVLGQRRIGKSSLLYHLTQVKYKHLKIPEPYRLAYLDLQDPRCHTVENLLHHTLEELGLVAPTTITLEIFYETIEKSREESGLWPVLLMDEFEKLIERPKKFTDDFYDALRSLGNNNLLGIVTASQHSLKELAAQEKLTSPFFNIFHQIKLGEFGDGEVTALLNRGRVSDRPFSESDFQEIIKIAGNHPGRLQIVSSLVYEAKANDQTLNWKAIKNEAQAEPAFDANAISGYQKKNWLKNAAVWLFINLPQIIGRAFLELIGREDVADTTAWFWGIVWLIVAVVLVTGIVSWSTVTHYVRKLFGLILK